MGGGVEVFQGVDNTTITLPFSESAWCIGLVIANVTNYGNGIFSVSLIASGGVEMRDIDYPSWHSQGISNQISTISYANNSVTLTLGNSMMWHDVTFIHT